jgi:phosphoribosylformylglycinamidine synthase subunit PurQ / glutaminase
MKVGVVVFPGSNCDHDTYHVAKHVLGQEAVFVWHKDGSLGDVDAVILPGGFAYGDYLRTGAVARFSPIMRAVTEFAARGGPVLGICNGFQILQEAGLLPGAMLRNKTVQFLSVPVHVRVETSDTIVTGGIPRGTVLTMPIAHGEGNFYLPDHELDRLEGEGRVVFRYVTADGQVSEEANVNGSSRAIAGVCNGKRNVVGLMPHPERACHELLGSTDGAVLLRSVLTTLV